MHSLKYITLPYTLQEVSSFHSIKQDTIIFMGARDGRFQINLNIDPHQDEIPIVSISTNGAND